MEVIVVEYFPISIDTGNNEEKYEFHSYISDDNEQDACDSYSYMVHIFRKKESGRLVSVMSIVWENTGGYANLYRCALDIYLITVL